MAEEEEGTRCPKFEHLKVLAPILSSPPYPPVACPVIDHLISCDKEGNGPASPHARAMKLYCLLFQRRGPFFRLDDVRKWYYRGFEQALSEDVGELVKLGLMEEVEDNLTLAFVASSPPERFGVLTAPEKKHLRKTLGLASSDIATAVKRQKCLTGSFNVAQAVKGITGGIFKLRHTGSLRLLLRVHVVATNLNSREGAWLRCSDGQVEKLDRELASDRPQWNKVEYPSLRVIYGYEQVNPSFKTPAAPYFPSESYFGVWNVLADVRWLVDQCRFNIQHNKLQDDKLLPPLLPDVLSAEGRRSLLASIRPSADSREVESLLSGCRDIFLGGTHLHSSSCSTQH